MNSATKRWRLTIDDNGVLFRTALTLLLSAFLMCGAKAQVRDLVYGTNNVVVGPTNSTALSFTNTVTFSNALTIPQATGLSSATANGIQWRSIYPSSNGLIALSGTDDQGHTTFRISTGTMSGTTAEVALFNANAVTFYKPLGFNNTTNAATTRTNLGVTVASNLPAPYSGGASINSLLVSDGAGSSAFAAAPNITVSSIAGSNFNFTTNGERRLSSGTAAVILSRGNGNSVATLQYLGTNSFTSEVTIFGDIGSGRGFQFAYNVDENNVVEQRRGTTATNNGFRWYGVWSNSTNYRRLYIGHDGTNAYLRPESAGPLATNNLIYISGLPTNSAGLPSGVLWNSNGSVVVSP